MSKQQLITAVLAILCIVLSGVSTKLISDVYEREEKILALESKVASLETSRSVDKSFRSLLTNDLKNKISESLDCSQRVNGIRLDLKKSIDKLEPEKREKLEKISGDLEELSSVLAPTPRHLIMPKSRP